MKRCQLEIVSAFTLMSLALFEDKSADFRHAICSKLVRRQTWNTLEQLLQVLASCDLYKRGVKGQILC